MAAGQERIKPVPATPTGQTTAAAEALSPPDPTKVLDQIDTVLGSVRVTHGANDEEFQVAGKSVSAVRRSLKGAFNIPDDAQALVKGDVVDENYKLKEGDQLEFVKQSGTKG